jgi:hypothetical protein
VAVTGACTNVIVVDGTFTNNGQYGLNIVKAFPNLSGTQTFDNNKYGNIFQNPSTCVSDITTLDNVTTLNNDIGSNSVTSLSLQAPLNFHSAKHYHRYARRHLHGR